METLSAFIAWARRKPAATVLAFIVGVACAGAVWARFYHLGTPDTKVFDEVYFPVFGYDYLHAINFFDVHPPLGKLIIAIGLLVFGNVPFGWRIMPALFGIALPILGGYCWYVWKKERLGALLMAVFLAVETILIVYSRTGLMDGIQLFFILATFASALKAKQRHQAFWPALFLGLAVGIKWISLGVIVPVAYVLWRRGILRSFIYSLPFSLAVYVLVVYVGQVLIGTPDPAQGVLEWHRQAWDYQLGLTATHPWSSKWWSWPLMLRPVLFYYQNDDQGRILMITALGNPILWWSATLATILSLIELVRLWFKDRGAILNHTLTPLLIGYLSFFLPWIPIHRVVFIYHYLPCYAFALLMLTYWLTRVWRRQPWIVTVFVAVVVGLSFYYLPLAMGLPITQESLNQRLWFHSWL